MSPQVIRRPHLAKTPGSARTSFALYQAKRHQMALRHRRRLVRARARFQQELDRALRPSIQKKLGVTVCLDERYLARPGFMAQFEFAGHHWVLTCQPKPWGCDWYFRRTGGLSIIQCNRQTLALELQCALSPLIHQRSAAVSA